MYVRVLLFSLVMITSVAAQQQQPDPAFLQRAISAVQSQRNLAMDAAAVAEAKVAAVTAELDKAQARVKELEAKVEEKK